MPSKTLQIRNSIAEFLIFTKQAGESGIEVRVQDGTIWLSQKLMASLFDCSTDNIYLHLKSIYAEEELGDIKPEYFYNWATVGQILTKLTKYERIDMRK